jgi:hypothetical protein
LIDLLALRKINFPKDNKNIENNDLIEFLNTYAGQFNHLFNILSKEDYSIFLDSLDENLVPYYPKSTIFGKSKRHVLVMPHLLKWLIWLCSDFQPNFHIEIYDSILFADDLVRKYALYEKDYWKAKVQKSEEDLEKIQLGKEENLIDKVENFCDVGFAVASTDQYFYIVSDKDLADQGFFKIGITTDPKKRIANYNTSRPEHLPMQYYYIIKTPFAKIVEERIIKITHKLEAEIYLLRKEKQITKSPKKEFIRVPLVHLKKLINVVKKNVDSEMQHLNLSLLELQKISDQNNLENYEFKPTSTFYSDDDNTNKIKISEQAANRKKNIISIAKFSHLTVKELKDRLKKKGIKSSDINKKRKNELLYMMLES